MQNSPIAKIRIIYQNDKTNRSKFLDQPPTFQRFFQNPGERVLCPGGGDSGKKGLKRFVTGMSGEMVGKQALKLRMKTRAVVGMVQMGEFVDQDIVL